MAHVRPLEGDGGRHSSERAPFGVADRKSFGLSLLSGKRQRAASGRGESQGLFELSQYSRGLVGRTGTVIEGPLVELDDDPSPFTPWTLDRAGFTSRTWIATAL
jgi:hypothetical protein